MPGIFTALSSTAYSLQSQSFVVQQTGKNIANINNEGYSRQRVQMGTTGAVQTAAGPTSGPLVATGIEHIRDVFLDRQILGEISYLSGLEASDFRLKQALANLGDTINRAGDAQFVDDIVQSGGGLRGAIYYFFDTFESFAANLWVVYYNKPLFEELLREVNRLIGESRRRLERNQMLLHRSREIGQRFLHMINPEPVSKGLYARNGHSRAKSSPVIPGHYRARA